MIKVDKDEVIDNVLRSVKQRGLREILVFTQSTERDSLNLMGEIGVLFSKKGYKVKVHPLRRYVQLLDNGARIHFGHFLTHSDVECAHELAGMVFQTVIYDRIVEDLEEIPRTSPINYVASRVRM